MALEFYVCGEFLRILSVQTLGLCKAVFILSKLFWLFVAVFYRNLMSITSPVAGASVNITVLPGLGVML
jgi:hypothetical protein